MSFRKNLQDPSSPFFADVHRKGEKLYHVCSVGQGFLSASSSLASLARASSTSAGVTEVAVVAVAVVAVVAVGIPQLSFALRNYRFLL